MPPKYRKCRDCSKNGYDECLCRFCQKCGFTGHTEDRCIAELHYRCKQVHEPGKCPQGKPPDAEPEPKDADADKLDDSLGHITYASGSDTAEQDPHDTSLDSIEGWDSLPSDTESELEVSRLQPRRAEICSPAEPQIEKGADTSQGAGLRRTPGVHWPCPRNPILPREPWGGQSRTDFQDHA
jgi:hypothetical protein